MEIVAMLPWWAAMALALVSYLLLHSVASQPIVPATQPGTVGTMLRAANKTLSSKIDGDALRAA